jgi:16S rRNA (cytosine967-C5)-methyltransferase
MTLHPKTVARQAALRALCELERHEASGGTNLPGAQLTREQRAFEQELTFGLLRTQARLDHTITPLLKKPLASLDAPVRAALRLAAYERYFLGTQAAVAGNEYAALMRYEKLTSATALVSAVARRLPAVLKALPARLNELQRLSMAYSHPAWLVQRWLARLDFDECRALCEINNRIAPLSLRVNTLHASREQVLAALAERGITARAGELSPDAVLVENSAAFGDWPEWRDGWLIAQDEAAQLVTLLAAPEPGQRVIDGAAAPGGKTTHLAQLVGNNGTIIACDVAPGRVKLVDENARRLGLSSIETRVGDLRRLQGELAPADLVLLDAPCLGTGTWRRRPDARWRKAPRQLAELCTLQRDLLVPAAALVRPGGHLVYATCSLEPEENQEPIRQWLSEHSGWEVVPPAGPTFAGGLARDIVTAEGFLQTWPQRHGCDGMFAAKLRRCR